MIIDEKESHWIYVMPSEERELPENWAEHGGKWIVPDILSNLRKLAQKIDSYVEEGQISSAKFDRKSSLGYPTPSMMIYCLDTEKERVWSILSKLGVSKHIWKYDKQTYKDWEPGGRLWKMKMKQMEDDSLRK